MILPIYTLVPKGQNTNNQTSTANLKKMGGVRTSAAIFILFLILLPLASARSGGDGLLVGFYNKTCPRAEIIVAEVVSDAWKKDPGIAAGLLRIFFHDCLTHGCDASILLDATPSGEDTEKRSPANGKLMRGFDVIDVAKARLELECPGTVSCADVLTFATRDGSVQAGVPRYPVAGGRRDSLVSRAEDVGRHVPFSNWPVQNMTEFFVRHGLTQADMVVLTGAHSIGVAHCPSFMYRVHGYNKTFETDPKLNAADAANIRSACQQVSLLAKTTLPFDTQTPFKMDNNFYKHLLEGKGLLESDQEMAIDPKTRSIVERMASNERKWLKMFGRSMTRLAAMDVKTGTEGEIRKRCRFVNSDTTHVNSGDAVDSGNTGDSGKQAESGNAFDPINKIDSGNAYDSNKNADSGNNFDSSNNVGSRNRFDSHDTVDSPYSRLLVRPPYF